MEQDNDGEGRTVTPKRGIALKGDRRIERWNKIRVKQKRKRKYNMKSDHTSTIWNATGRASSGSRFVGCLYTKTISLP